MDRCTAFEPHQSKSLVGKGQKGAAFRWTDEPSTSSYWVEKWIGTSAEGGWVVKLVSLPEKWQPDDGHRRAFNEGRWF
jgi:hypothetical protein